MKKHFVLASTIILATSVTLPAVSNAQSNQQVTEYSNQSKILDEETIKMVDQYIIIENNKFKITNNKELKEKISKSNLNKVKKQLDEVNKIVAKNDSIKKINKDTIQVKMTDEELKAKLEKSGYEYDLDIENKIDNTKLNSFSSLNQSDGIQLLAASSNGINKVDWHWWGAEVWLSKTTVNNIINAGIAGGSVVLGALIPGLGAAALIALNGYIGSIYAGKYARECIFNVNWMGNVSKFRYQ
jgi:hypothetical protein